MFLHFAKNTMVNESPNSGWQMISVHVKETDSEQPVTNAFCTIQAHES